MEIIVFGAGLIGPAIVQDLFNDGDNAITVADRSPEALQSIQQRVPGVGIVEVDVSDSAAVKSTVENADIVVSAVPGFLGYNLLKAVIEAGKDIVDLAFADENVLELNDLAVANGVTAIVDFGVAPGMSNLLMAYGETLLDDPETAITYVGGLPVIRRWPWQYKAPFSPGDVIEIYTRPARYVEGGKMVTVQPLSDPEFLDFPEIGTLEAFNTDGLRTAVHMLKSPNRKEKTLRYVGHREKITILQEAGLLSTEEVDVRGTKVRPLDLTCAVLFPQWKLEPGDEDITVMRVINEGIKDGARVRHQFDLFDRSDPITKTHSLARTTGYAVTMGVRLIKERVFTQKGVIPPETVGVDHDCVKFVLEGLSARGVVYTHTTTPL